MRNIDISRWLSFELLAILALSLNGAFSVVILSENVLVSDLGECLLFESSEKVPSTLEGSENVTLFVFTLLEELVLELLEEE
jgi:hypothetical protein